MAKSDYGRDMYRQLTGRKANNEAVLCGQRRTVHIPNAYKYEVTYGENIKALVMVLYGQGVQSLDRIVELIYALTGNVMKLSEGTVSNWLEETRRRSEQTKKKIEKHLLDAPQVSTDGTVVTENGNQSYIQNFSVLDWVLYESMGSKGHKALSSILFFAAIRRNIGA